MGNAKENSKLHGVEDRVKIVHADLFDNKEIIARKFDLIYWNPPWIDPGHEDSVEPLLKSIVDPGYNSIRRFLSNADMFLKTTGRLMVGHSFVIGSEKHLKAVARDTGWRFEVCLTSKDLTFDGPCYECVMLEFHK